MVAQELDLTRRAVGGDRRVLAQLLERSAPVIRQRLAGKLPRRWQHALSIDDVMQQTFVDAFIDIERFTPNGEGSFSAWLGTLAQHNLLDALRMLEADKRGNGRSMVRFQNAEESFVSLAEILQAADRTPSRLVARQEAYADLKSAVRQLPDLYRQVVRMYDLEVRPVSDVARELRRSPGAVYMIRARAHRQLRQIMGSVSAYLTGG